MSAPALILLAHGSQNEHTTACVRAMRKDMQVARPELAIHLAFIEGCPPSGPQVVNQLARRGVREVVFVPLQIGASRASDTATAEIIERTRIAHPDLRISLAEPLGPQAALLRIVDERLREALSRAHVGLLDGLVLAVQGEFDTRGRDLVARRARQWSSHHKLPVTIAQGDDPHAMAQAVAHLQSSGRRHIAVGSLFVTASDLWEQQARAALAAGAVAVGTPLGNESAVQDIALARYVVAAMGMLELDSDAPRRTAVAC